MSLYTNIVWTRKLFFVESNKKTFQELFLNVVTDLCMFLCKQHIYSNGEYISKEASCILEDIEQGIMIG